MEATLQGRSTREARLPPPLRATARTQLLGALGALVTSGLIVLGVAHLQGGPASSEPVDVADDLRAIALPPPPPPLPARVEAAPASPPEEVRIEQTAGDVTVPMVEPYTQVGLDQPPAAVPHFEFAAENFDPRTHGAGPSDVYDVSQVDQPAQMVFAQTPDISSKLLKTVDDPRVTLLYIVNKEGRAENIQVLHSVNDEFNAVLIRAIAGSRFRPAMKDGRPVLQWVQQSLRFTSAAKKNPFER